MTMIIIIFYWYK